RRSTMFDYIVSGIVAAFLLVYLGWAMFQPEKFLRRVMTTAGILQILLFFGLIWLLTKPTGLFMSRLFQGERTFLHPIVRPLETAVYKVCGIREDQEQRWTHYARSVLALSFFAFLIPYAMMRLQGPLPLN